MQITSFTPSPSCINPPSPGTPHTFASRSRVLPGHTSTLSTQILITNHVRFVGSSLCANNMEKVRGRKR